MCGITGYLLVEEGAKAPDLCRMNNTLIRRGPDDEGYYEQPGIGLAARRLSIIDLETGRQPISNEAGTVWTVYNGEIYNFNELRGELERAGHRFTTRSDTEVLVHGYEEWGTQLPTRLRGMFAFAIWDGVRRKLFLARDHAGVKPLYYAHAQGCLLFASEIKALLVCDGVSRELNPHSLDRCVTFLYLPEPDTIFRGVRALEAGHTLVCDDTGLTVRKYWQYQYLGNRFQSRQEAVAAIRGGLRDAVDRMLVADVEVGVLLSGGIDSSAILAMASRSRRPQTFSVGFGSRERRWDELDAARSIAERFASRHHELRLTPKDIEALPEVVRGFDQPFANPTALVMYKLSEFARREVKAVLAGTGGDEMFAGYPRYQGMLLYQKYSRLPLLLRRALAEAAKALMRDSTDGRLWWQRVRRFFENGALPFADCYAGIVSVLDAARRSRLYSRGFLESLGESSPKEFLLDYLKGGVESVMEADVNTYLQFNQLAYVDRTSMRASLEVRVPFLDQPLIEVAAGIPLSWKLKGGLTKGLLREALCGLLPDSVLKAPKVGLNLPVALWFREELKGWLSSLLSREKLRKRGYFEYSEVDLLLREHISGRRDNSQLLWALAVFELWLQEYF